MTRPENGADKEDESGIQAKKALTAATRDAVRSDGAATLLITTAAAAEPQWKGDAALNH